MDKKIEIKNVEKESEPEFKVITNNTLTKDGMTFDTNKNKGLKNNTKQIWMKK